MWRDNDQPYQGTLPADLSDESSDSAGYADMVTDIAFAVIVIVIVAMIAMAAWVIRTGGIPPWLK